LNILIRKGEIMSFEKQSEALIEACTNLIQAATDKIKDLKLGAPATTSGADTVDLGCHSGTGSIGVNANTTTDPDYCKAGKGRVGIGTVKVTKKQLAELKAAAKAAAGDVMKKLGQEKLAELLSRFGTEKFSGLISEADVFINFKNMAEEMLAKVPSLADEDDDLLGDAPAPKVYTLEDVKALLLKVNNSPSLGKEVSRQILAELGAARLPELKKENYAEAIDKAEAAFWMTQRKRNV
jgi:hypothetical protein